MSLSSGIAAILNASQAVTTSVPGKTVKAYAHAVRQRDNSDNIIDPPYIVISELTTDFFLTIDGTGAVATDKKQRTIDIDSYGVTEAEAELVRQSVAMYLDDFSGAAGTNTIAAVDLTDAGQDEIPPRDGDGYPTFIKTLEAEVIFS